MKKHKTISQLLKIAQRHFNAFIRERDKGPPCINCGACRTLQAGHLFPTSTYSGLRFDEYNVNGECLQCNYYNSQSHAYGYKVNLMRKIGHDKFTELEIRAGMVKRGHRWDRFTLENIINKYKPK